MRIDTADIVVTLQYCWKVLQATTANLLRHVSRLHCLTDNIALLDMLCALATVACTSGGQYVRPKMTDLGPIAIVEGRHVLLENINERECQVRSMCTHACLHPHDIKGCEPCTKPALVIECPICFR